MRLSEAIRLGAMLKPRQAFGAWLDEDGGTCAIGAALDAFGALNADGTADEQKWAEAVKCVRPTTFIPNACPACFRTSDRVDDTMRHLNNHHRWTREQIADWVESIERTLEAPQSVAAADPGVSLTTTG